MKYFSAFFYSKKTYYSLLLVHLILGIAIFSISSKTTFNDGKAYWLMGESLLQGKFSSWYFLPNYYPETLRTPGYPFLIACCQLISKNSQFLLVIQLCIYFICVFLFLDSIKHINRDIIYRNVFLLLLLPNIQVVYYSGLISSEILATFAASLFVWLLFKEKTKGNAFGLGLVSCLLFLTKPSFLLLPFLLFLISLVFQRKRLSLLYHFIFVITFAAGLIPFTLWNKHNHQIAKITPLEGGGGTAMLGFWQLKLPDRYRDSFYWGNTITPDYIKPNLFSKADLENNVLLFEKEWVGVLSRCSSYLSSRDSADIEYMKKNNPGIFILFNSRFTNEREKELWKVVVADIKKEPVFYIVSRVYHLFRFYVTGINPDQLAAATSSVKKMMVIYPFIVSFIFIFCGLICASFYLVFNPNVFPNQYTILIMAWYAGLIHIPFATQSRYTIPVHLIIIMLFAVCSVHLFLKKHSTPLPGK